MNKTAIKNFSIYARKKLIDDVSFEAGLLGITDKGIAAPLKQSTSDLQFFDIGTKKYVEISGPKIKQRNALAAAIQKKAQEVDYANAFKFVMEEVAYTWFNRLIAIRFMEVNDYLPDHVRVLSSDNSSKLEPDIVTRPFDTGLEFTSQERNTILQMKDDGQLDELFRMLFIKQCDVLRSCLPGLFEHTTEYAELLLSISYMDTDGVVYHLTHDIEEKYFNVTEEGQVEIIGWLYQYYNTEPKSEAFAKGTITKDEIPAVTQLFTPDWIVRYMVENSLGRLWLDGHPDTAEIFLPSNHEQEAYIAGQRDNSDTKWHYYLEEAEQEPSVQEQLNQIRAEHAKLNPEDIRLIDPCMGSGHILVYAFDVFMQIYLSQGYLPRDAARNILKYNLFGADIDPRAYQLAYFAVMMKARQYNRRILTEGIEPNLAVVRNPRSISSGALKQLGDLEVLGRRLLDTFREAEEFGSILEVEFTEQEMTMLASRLDHLSEQAFYANLLDAGEMNECVFVLKPLLKQARILGQKYHVTVTNPPYMAPTEKQKSYVEKKYPATKVDLYTLFIEKCGLMLVPFGYQGMITQHGWMFLSSFEKTRLLISQRTVVNLAHLGPRSFDEINGEIVQTASFVFCGGKIPNYIGSFSRLIAPTSEQTKCNLYLSKTNLYYRKGEDFIHIPGSPLAYWISDELADAFSGNLLSQYAVTKQGFATGSNDTFLRLWYEVSSTNSSVPPASMPEVLHSTMKWFPCNKGGSFRKWYGNNCYLANWADDGREMRAFSGSVIRNPQFYFREGITWSSLGTQLSLRYSPEGFLFESKGSMCYVKDSAELWYILAILNSKITAEVLSILSPTLDFHEGPMSRVPILKCTSHELVTRIAKNNVKLCRTDWDSFETSWDFKTHPLISVIARNRVMFDDISNIDLADCFMCWENECNDRFAQLKANEEELNRIFIETYGLQNELTPEVDDKDVTIRKADLKRDIKSLISYAVGCMFGRYSLSTPGIAYAGGEWDSSKYSGIIPDADNCIPITDTPYFEDDIITRFVEFVRQVYGEKSLEANLQFIANALGNKGDTSREVIRNYFLSDFFKDHEKIYQKRPIYWLFDSGKQNGFKALVYMHRWNADTIGNVRAEYLERMQKKLDSEMERMDAIIDGSSSSRDITKAQKQKEKLRKQAKECADYSQKLSHLANYRIDIDLDDGVKVNYRKVQTDPNGKFFEILADSKDIMVKEKK